MSNEATAKEEPQAGFRLDLVRRLFAVAISLGVGTAIVRADWVTQGRWPVGQEREQIAIVLLALFATVLSWDGYLLSVTRKPLNDWLRFAIDVFLVFTYMFLLVTSNKSNFWLPIVCVMYALYVLWDALSILQFPTLFDASPEAKERAGILTMGRVFILAIFDRAGIDRGPLISLVWAAYFFALLAITRRFPAFNPYAALALAAAGMAIYRADKAKGRNEVRGFTTFQRAAAFIVLLLAAFLAGCASGAIQKP
ncbi:hypothetical protein JQ543_30680 [Bradyrhizobium diazoefficiens]|nr:hypothetical protein [Bradyrhizobium diazoefficiens]MBR0852136.1 hypothetical protein [Bradyrhizobium diazoefficiens]